jgi:hypothetical protein
MKVASLLLAGMLLAAPVAVEFNSALCGPHGYATEHIVIATNADNKETLSFVSYLDTDNAVVEDKDPVICAVSDKSDKDGVTQYVTKCKLEDGNTVDLVALTDGKKIIAMVKHEGDLTAVVFGVAGPESKLVDGALGDADSDKAFCLSLVRTDEEKVPQVLATWLKTGVTPLSAQK